MCILHTFNTINIKNKIYFIINLLLIYIVLRGTEYS